jgi:hypothetical protein
MKGVGWALRDVMRGDRKKVLKYVKELRRNGVSTVITVYAKRDLRGEERSAVLNSRRLTNARPGKALDELNPLHLSTSG